jgi:CRISPR system Cascade subunit CasD
MSFGHDSYFNHRHTALWPTKSAVIGLIAAASGWDKLDPDSREFLVPLAACKLTVWRFARTDMISPLRDYHTVGADYDGNDPQERLRKPATAKNRSPKPNAEVTHRYYLEDLRFGAVLSGPPDIISGADAALAAPRWGVWFGRKCCIPAAPVRIGIAGEFADARDKIVSHLMNESPHWCAETVPKLEEIDGDDPESVFVQSDLWNDHPISFGPMAHERSFVRREVREVNEAL